MKRLIIYDLDGTLVDTREDIACAANDMLKKLGGSPLTTAAVAAFVGKGLHALIRGCLKTEDPKKIEQGSKIYRAYYAEHMLDHSKLYPGAVEFLEYFKLRKQAVITNKPNPYSREILEALGIARYFIEIVAGDSDYPKKPDPAAVLSVMKREKVNPSSTLFVGDSAIDIETARNAGISAAVVTHGFSHRDELQSKRPDALVKDFFELLSQARKERW